MTERRKVNNDRLTNIESAEISTYGEICTIWKQIMDLLKQLLARTYFHYIKLTLAGIQIQKAVLVIIVFVFPEVQSD